MVGRNGVGRVPTLKYLINPRHDQTGFGEFQPESTKIGIKTALIGAGRIRLVGLGGFCPPLPASNKVSHFGKSIYNHHDRGGSSLSSRESQKKSWTHPPKVLPELAMACTSLCFEFVP
jgi:hypothetical protein